MSLNPTAINNNSFANIIRQQFDIYFNNDIHEDSVVACVHFLLS